MRYRARLKEMAAKMREQRHDGLKPYLEHLESLGYRRIDGGYDIILKRDEDRREIYFYINQGSAVPGEENLIYVQITERHTSFEIREQRRIDLENGENVMRILEREISPTRAWAVM